MADPVGLAFGVLGAFNVVLEDINLLYAVADFGLSFRTNVVQLANAQLRLSRWGKSLGLTEEDTYSSANKERMDAAILMALQPEAERQGALTCLEQMQELLQSARNKMASYDNKTGSGATDNKHRMLNLLHRNKSETSAGVQAEKLGPAEEEPEEDELCKDIRNLSISRQAISHQASLRKRVWWALHDKKVFGDLVRNITHLLGDLEKLFAGSKPARDDLAAREVQSLGVAKVREMLNCLIGSVETRDKSLERALRDTTEKGETSTNVVFGDYNQGMQSNGGDYSGSTFNFGAGSRS